MKLIDRLLNKNKEGFIKENVTLARVGAMDYLGSELGMGLKPNEVYQVYVEPDELFKKEVIDSAEGATVTLTHPETLEVTLDGFEDGWDKVAVGHVQNIYQDGDYLKGTIFVKNPNAIKVIEEQGIKEVSLGYDSDIIEKDGKLIKTNIRANHLAIEPQGRCGSACKIGDSKKVDKEMAQKKSKWIFADAFARWTGGKTTQQKAVAKKIGDAKKVISSKAKKLADSSESLKQKLADLEEVNVNPDATPEEKAAASQELQTEVIDTISEAVSALQESVNLVSDVEEEVQDMPTQMGDATLPEGVSIPDELAGYVSELESERDQAQAALEEANARIKELEDELASIKGETETATAVADAKARFPKLKIGDAKSVRQVQESVLKQKGVYNDAQLKTLSDCSVAAAYQGIVASASNQNNFGKKLIGDSKPKPTKTATQRLGGK